jgi:hypothetical protein
MPHGLEDYVLVLLDRCDDVVVRRLAFVGQIGVEEVGG